MDLETQPSGQLDLPPIIPPVATGLMTPGSGGHRRMHESVSTVRFLVFAGLATLAVAALAWAAPPEAVVPPVLVGILMFLIPPDSMIVRERTIISFVASAVAAAAGMILFSRGAPGFERLLEFLGAVVVSALLAALTGMRWFWAIEREYSAAV